MKTIINKLGGWLGIGDGGNLIAYFYERKRRLKKKNNGIMYRGTGFQHVTQLYLYRDNNLNKSPRTAFKIICLTTI